LTVAPVRGLGVAVAAARFVEPIFRAVRVFRDRADAPDEVAFLVAFLVAFEALADFFDPIAVRARFGAADLRAADLRAADFRAAGFRAADFRAAGFRAAGFRAVLRPPARRRVAFRRGAAAFLARAGRVERLRLAMMSVLSGQAVPPVVQGVVSGAVPGACSAP
jgi:hypothetical protein